MQATVNGFRMNFAVEGPDSAPTVILHHPLATDLTIWDELTAALAPRYRVVRFDARGQGASEATKAPYAFDTLTADVVQLMDHLGLARVHYLGLSMGGMVGQHLGLTHPQRFASLTLCSTSSRIPDEAKPLWEERVKAAREKGMAAQVDLTLSRWLASASLQGKPALVARMRRYIEATPVEGYAGWCGAIRDLNVTERLKGIPLPTLVIVGAEDPSTPPAAAQVIHREIAGSELIEVPGVSHQLHVEDSATFNRHVLDFLSRQP
ncbi:MAG: alpha/beta fold hydrolase [Hyphomicrobiaceae bacterium]|nr:alpha/beta fold hydrolase [Hyphomicrobiaceae bacterium]